MKIIVRPAESTDHAFIFATYLRNRYFDKANNTTLKRSTWSKLQHKRLEDILALPRGGVLVACLSEDLDTILGYSLIDGDGPFTYVKLSWRSEGLNVKGMLLKELLK